MIAIIQARLGSKRLPRKVLMTVNDKPLIRYMVERLKQSRLLEMIVIAVPLKDAEEIRDAAGCYTIGYNGAENNVLRRFRDCLLKNPDAPAHFIRLCADSPLIDPALVDWMIEQYRGTMLTNTKPRTFPAGQCIEIIPAKGFIRGVTDEDDYDREHVTPWIYRHFNYTNVMNPLGDFSAVNMCVDTEQDFDRISQVIGKMTRPHWEYGWRELMELMA